MRVNLMLSAALTFVVASAGGAFAQSMQNDRTGDHLVSYGPVTPSPAPARVHTSRRVAKARASSAPQVPLDRTPDHLFYYGPIQ